MQRGSWARKSNLIRAQSWPPFRYLKAYVLNSTWYFKRKKKKRRTKTTDVKKLIVWSLTFQRYVYGLTPGLNQTYILPQMPPVHDYCGQAMWELIAKCLWTSPAYSLLKVWDINQFNYFKIVVYLLTSSIPNSPIMIFFSFWCYMIILTSSSTDCTLS